MMIVLFSHGDIMTKKPQEAPQVPPEGCPDQCSKKDIDCLYCYRGSHYRAIKIYRCSLFLGCSGQYFLYQFFPCYGCFKRKITYFDVLKNSSLRNEYFKQCDEDYLKMKEGKP